MRDEEGDGRDDGAELTEDERRIVSEAWEHFQTSRTAVRLGQEIGRPCSLREWLRGGPPS